MRKMEFTGGFIKDFKLSSEGDRGYLTVAVSSFKNNAKQTTWLCVVLRDALLKRYQEKPIKGAINVGGTFDITSYTDPKGKMYPKIYVYADWYEAAEASGSGLFRVSLSKVRLVEDTREAENVGFVKMVFNYMKNNTDTALWLDASLWGDVLKRAKSMKLKKNSTIDLDAEIDIKINEKDGNQYLNVMVNVMQMKYSALPPKTKKDDAEETPQPEQKPSQPKPNSTSPVTPKDVQESNLDSDLAGAPDENEYF